MKVKLCNKIATVLICIFAFTILFSMFSVKATDDTTGTTSSSNVNRVYAVTTNDTTFQSTSTPGNPINATIMVPNGTTEPMPLVVMCHGYTGNRRGDDDHFIRLGSILAQHGIAAVTIDFPGCGDSTAAESAYTLSNMYEYINSAISNMSSRYDIDSSRIGLVGHSMGGRVVSMYTQTGSHSVAGIALWAPANGDGSMGYDFLNKGSFSFGASDTFFSEMDNSYPNSVLSSYSGSIFLAEDGVDARGEGVIDSSIVEQTKNAVSSQGGEVKDYSGTNHNFNDSEGGGGQVVDDTANFFGKLFLGIELVEGSGEEKYQEPLYTIEDIIFNRIPILDINFFSDTAGGQPVSEGSAVGVIRTTVSVWYTSFRNLVIIALAIIIIYIGIRMALSTIPNDKAKYKTMMIGWVQALVIVLVVHFIMILIINTNNSLVALLEKASQDMMTANGWVEDSIYETIRTRAYDLRLSVGLSGTIMYVALVIIWVKFLWVYIKRAFTILILVIIAPFIGAKYAIDSARGKKGSSFSSWLYDFTLNVLLQTVHAIVYTVLMTAAINFAFSSIVGYIIALVFMNFMLDADDIFRSIFNFESKSDLAEEAARKESRKEVMQNFAGAMFVGSMAKTTFGFAKGLGTGAVRAGRRFTRYLGRTFPNASENVGSRVNSALNAVDTRIENVARNMQNNQGGNNQGNSPRTWRNQALTAVQRQAQLRRLSREKGVVGVKARQIKNSISKNRKKRFKSNVDFIKKAATGSISTLLAAPMAVVNPVAGLTMFTTGLNTLKKTRGKKHYKAQKDGTIIKQSDMNYKAEKYTKKRDKQYSAADLLDKINSKETSIEEKAEAMKKLDENKFNSFKADASIVLEEVSESKLEELIDDYIKENNITTIDNYSINDIIDAISQAIGVKITKNDSLRSILSEKARTKIVFLRNKKEAEERSEGNEGIDAQTVDTNNDSKYGYDGEKTKSENDSRRNESKFGYADSPSDNSNNENDTKDESTTTYTKSDIVKIIQESATEAVIEDKGYQDLTKDLFKLDKDIKDFEGKAKTKYRGANKFMEGL